MNSHGARQRRSATILSMGIFSIPLQEMRVFKFFAVREKWIDQVGNEEKKACFIYTYAIYRNQVRN